MFREIFFTLESLAHNLAPMTLSDRFWKQLFFVMKKTVNSDISVKKSISSELQSTPDDPNWELPFRIVEQHEHLPAV